MKRLFADPLFRLAAYCFCVLLLYLPTGGGDSIYYLRYYGIIDQGNLVYIIVRCACYIALACVYIIGENRPPPILTFVARICFSLAFLTEILPPDRVPILEEYLGFLHTFWTQAKPILPRSVYMTPWPSLLHGVAILALCLIALFYRNPKEGSNSNLT